MILNAMPSLIAYIDPGVGSMLIQILAAGIISAGLFFRGLRDRVLAFAMAPFRSRNNAAETTEAPNTADESPSGERP